MSHLGRDFASFQGNLTPADCAGIEFAFVKATEGADYKNPYAPQQCAALRAAGVHVGYYHFFQPGVNVLDQLDNFHKMISALGPTKLPFALDNEVADGAGWPDLASKAMDFVQAVESWKLYVPNPRSISYVNVSFYKALPGFPWGRWVWLADPNPGAPHEPCLILQSAPRPVSGTDLKVVDPDTFLGSEADWAAFTGGTAPAPAPAPGPVPNPLGLPQVPGFNLAPGVPEVAVIGEMLGGGAFRGHNVTPGTTVYAGEGNPTRWVVNADLKTLPAGTSLAVDVRDLPKVQEPVVLEQL